MLKQLRIQNLILVDSADISFKPGLNILSGETGSGKSAIMEALSLILGERADKSIVRKGCDKGIVDAVFELDALPSMHELLVNAGIDHDEQEDLFIRREISISGKSRAFVNHQPVQLTLIRQVSQHLMKFVGQHANQQLFDLDQQRHILDCYGDCLGLVKEFSEQWSRCNLIRSKLHDLISSEAKRFREMEICRMELDEILEAAVKPGEEEELFTEYSRLTHADELIHHASGVVEALAGDKQSVLASLHRQKTSLERLAQLDPSLEDHVQLFGQSMIGLQEIAYNLQGYVGRVESNPRKAEQINQRLNAITKIKKKYGPSLEEVEAYRLKASSTLSQIENTDLEIEALQEQLKQGEEACQTLAVRLTDLRAQAARGMEKELTKHLRELNMPKVEFEIRITSQKRTTSGGDCIEFFMAPNIGEHPISVKECASGGELSRLMLSLQVLLAGKEDVPSLVFDEIDANIGGKTAEMVGKKLSAIGNRHQVLCVTHFPQVAHFASHHLQITKQEIGGRTVTAVRILDKSSRTEEIHRMQGFYTKEDHL